MKSEVLGTIKIKNVYVPTFIYMNKYKRESVKINRSK